MASDPSPPALAAPFRAVDFAAELRARSQPMERDGKLYVVRLSPPLLVQTPALGLATSAFDDDGESLPFVHAAPGAALGAWLRRAEAAVLEQSVERKKEYFRKSLDDDAIRASFKSFFRDGDKVKFRVPADAVVFAADRRTPAEPADVLRAGAQVRCVLELSRVCFGRTEFGAQWRLVQAAPCPAPVCLIGEDSGEAGGGGGGGASDESDGEFV